MVKHIRILNLVTNSPFAMEGEVVKKRKDIQKGRTSD